MRIHPRTHATAPSSSATAAAAAVVASIVAEGVSATATAHEAGAGAGAVAVRPVTTVPTAPVLCVTAQTFAAAIVVKSETAVTAAMREVYSGIVSEYTLKQERATTAVEDARVRQQIATDALFVVRTTVTAAEVALNGAQDDVAGAYIVPAGLCDHVLGAAAAATEVARGSSKRKADNLTQADIFDIPGTGAGAGASSAADSTEGATVRYGDLRDPASALTHLAGFKRARVGDMQRRNIAGGMLALARLDARGSLRAVWAVHAHESKGSGLVPTAREVAHRALEATAEVCAAAHALNAAAERAVLINAACARQFHEDGILATRARGDLLETSARGANAALDTANAHRLRAEADVLDASAHAVECNTQLADMTKAVHALMSYRVLTQADANALRWTAHQALARAFDATVALPQFVIDGVVQAVLKHAYAQDINAGVEFVAVVGAGAGAARDTAMFVRRRIAPLCRTPISIPKCSDTCVANGYFITAMTRSSVCFRHKFGRTGSSTATYKTNLLRLRTLYMGLFDRTISDRDERQHSKRFTALRVLDKRMAELPMFDKNILRTILAHTRM